MTNAWLNLDRSAEREAANLEGQALTAAFQTPREQKYLRHPLGEREWLLQQWPHLSVSETFIDCTCRVKPAWISR